MVYEWHVYRRRIDADFGGKGGGSNALFRYQVATEARISGVEDLDGRRLPLQPVCELWKIDRKMGQRFDAGLSVSSSDSSSLITFAAIV